MKSFFASIIFCVLAFAGSHCSSSKDKQSGPDISPLAADLWRDFFAAEEKSQYQETLDPPLLQEHLRNTAYLSPKIPKGYPEPYLPYGKLKDPRIDPALARQPFLNDAIVLLGKNFFFDTRLSFKVDHGFGGGISCASCHAEASRFTDGRSLSIGVEGTETRRNAPTLLNAAYNSTLTWANPVFPLLEMQAKIPLFGDDPIEMGLKGKENDVLSFLFGADPEYIAMFQKAFGLDGDDLTSGAIDFNSMTSALAAYERTLIDFDTKFDRFLQNQMKTDESLSSSEKHGLELFFGKEKLASGETLPCAQCHAGLLLTDSFHYIRDGRYFNRKAFHNTGLYNIDGKGAYPLQNTGFANAAQLAADPSLMGQFRTPSLRFVSETGPYGHDGSFATLEDVIRSYAAGGRSSLSANGQNPYVDPLIKSGFTIEPQEVESLIAFLHMLK